MKKQTLRISMIAMLVTIICALVASGASAIAQSDSEATPQSPSYAIRARTERFTVITEPR